MRYKVASCSVHTICHAAVLLLDIRTLLPLVILSVAKDLKKVSRDAVERRGSWYWGFSTGAKEASEILHCVQDDKGECGHRDRAWPTLKRLC